MLAMPLIVAVTLTLGACGDDDDAGEPDDDSRIDRGHRVGRDGTRRRRLGVQR
jgi:hypothetical protein